MVALIVSVGAWFTRRITALGLSSLASFALTGPLGPILTGIANAIGAVITATCEIAIALSKSAEGRVVLGLTIAALGFFYLRFHYIEEGKAEARAKFAQVHRPCPLPAPQRRIR